MLMYALYLALSLTPVAAPALDGVHRDLATCEERAELAESPAVAFDECMAELGYPGIEN